MIFDEMVCEKMSLKQRCPLIGGVVLYLPFATCQLYLFSHSENISPGLCYIGYFSDHIINGSPRLYVQLSLLFSSMLSHGYVPKDFLLSTLVPIPKNRRKSLNNSDNYRAIALGSILGKLLDIYI